MAFTCSRNTFHRPHIGLAERRERRREKREIVKEPVKGVVDDSDKENENDNTANGRTGTKYLSKKKGGRPQAPGLALMHGFSSKAVGKNRLTVSSHFDYLRI